MFSHCARRAKLGRVRETPPRPLRESCQTRAVILDASGQGETRVSVSANATSLSHGRRKTSDGHGWPSVPVAKDGEKGPVFRPADERGLKPSLATTHAKASERVIADPLGWEDASKSVETGGLWGKVTKGYGI
ncbi:MAG: hypothetical protein P4L59_00280 [Desulfosporosinus sp.]|nr:hypothetical protein [Desulfosporosinus sp.]